MQWRTVAALAMAMFAVGGPVHAQRAAPETVTVGLYAVAPFVIAGPDGPHGILIDFFDQEIAPRMGVRFKWSAPVTTARLEQNLMHGRVMFNPILVKTAERQRGGIVFAGDVHIKFEPCIAVLPSNPLTGLSTPDDLTGMAIGWVQAGALPAFMHDAHVKLDLVGVPNWEMTNIEKLKAGRIQGIFFSDVYTPRYYAREGGVRLKLLKVPEPGTLLYGAFAPDVPAALVKRYELAAHDAFSKGRWEAFVQKALGDYVVAPL